MRRLHSRAPQRPGNLEPGGSRCGVFPGRRSFHSDSLKTRFLTLSGIVARGISPCNYAADYFELNVSAAPRSYDGTSFLRRPLRLPPQAGLACGQKVNIFGRKRIAGRAARSADAPLPRLSVKPGRRKKFTCLVVDEWPLFFAEVVLWISVSGCEGFGSDPPRRGSCAKCADGRLFQSVLLPSPIFPPSPVYPPPRALMWECPIFC